MPGSNDPNRNFYDSIIPEEFRSTPKASAPSPQAEGESAVACCECGEEIVHVRATYWATTKSGGHEVCSGHWHHPADSHDLGRLGDGTICDEGLVRPLRSTPKSVQGGWEAWKSTDGYRELVQSLEGEDNCDTCCDAFGAAAFAAGAASVQGGDSLDNQVRRLTDLARALAEPLRHAVEHLEMGAACESWFRDVLAEYDSRSTAPRDCPPDAPTDRVVALLREALGYIDASHGSCVKGYGLVQQALKALGAHPTPYKDPNSPESKSPDAPTELPARPKWEAYRSAADYCTDIDVYMDILEAKIAALSHAQEQLAGKSEKGGGNAVS